jgi:acyl-coenzyme A thioesterase PaaI-like protein
MAKLVYTMNQRAITAELKIRLKKPVPTGEELVVSGWVVSEARRLIECAAEARDTSGEIVAEATGKMVKV